MPKLRNIAQVRIEIPLKPFKNDVLDNDKLAVSAEGPIEPKTQVRRRHKLRLAFVPSTKLRLAKMFGPFSFSKLPSTYQCFFPLIFLGQRVIVLGKMPVTLKKCP